MPLLLEIMQMIRILAIAVNIYLIFYGNLFALPKMPLEEHKILYEAQESLKKKQVVKARKILENYVQNHPKTSNSLIYYMLGNARHLEGRIQKAYKAYKKGFSLNSKSFDLCLNLANTAYEIKKYSQAGQFFEKAYNLSRPKKTELLYHAGAAYYQNKSFKKAKKILRKTISGKKPEKSKLRFFIQVCLEVRAWKDAEQTINKLLNQDKTNTEYWELLSQVRLHRGDYKGAASAFEVIYKLKPATAKQLENLAQIYFYLNVPLKGLYALERAYGQRPSASQYEKLAAAAIHAQNTNKALKYLDKAIKKRPAFSYFLQKGQIYYKRGQWAKAAKNFKACVQKDSAQKLPYLLIGYCELEHKRFEQARTAFLSASKSKKYAAEALAALTALEDMAFIGQP